DAANAPNKTTVYVFGGSDNFSGNSYANSIFAVDIGSATTRLVAAPLPVPMDGLSAVYDARLDKIVLLGGYNGNVLSGIYVFDPASETLSAQVLALPAPRAQMG